MLAIVAPGQGAQTPGFLAPWLSEPAVADRLNWLGTVAGIDLAHYGTKADAETIRDTAIAQPLLVAAGLVTALQLFPRPADGLSRTGAVSYTHLRPGRAASGAPIRPDKGTPRAPMPVGHWTRGGS